MGQVATLLVAGIALLHAWIFVLESFLWKTPRGLRAFGMTPAQAEATAVLAKNQGVYNLFLAAGLGWSLVAPGPMAFQIKLFFLGCVAVAGLVGAMTVNKRILFVQTIPAALALLFLLA